LKLPSAMGRWSVLAWTQAIGAAPAGLAAAIGVSRGGEGGNNRQHARVEVKADHVAGRADPVGGQPGHDPGAAGRV
jgi:hypothetical protein